MKTQLTSSPMRFEVFQGVFVVTAMNIFNKTTGEYVCSMVQGEGRSWKEARKAFWADVPEDCWLTPRTDLI